MRFTQEFRHEAFREQSENLNWPTIRSITMKKIIISIMMISGFSAMAFAQRCTEDQILGMIKLKEPVETVLKACGTEDKREEGIKEKKQKKKIMITNKRE